MDNFLKLFEDQRFIDWVTNPTDELEEFWTDYIKINHDEKEDIMIARAILLHLQSNTNKVVEEASSEIYASIIKQLEIKNKKQKRKIFLNSYLKYAAVGILFFTLGIAFNHYLKSEKEIITIADEQVDNSQEYSKLILADGNNVVMPEKKSEIEYRPNGQIVINKKDTFDTGNDIQDQDINQLFVPYGKNASIKLPDGTLAYLNAGSQLSYPSKFEGAQRIVSLIGEGFFEVAHNKNMPFIVNTVDLQVEVLGTRFDLSAYPSDKIVETILVEGKVKLIELGTNISNTEYILEPNQRAVFNLETKETMVTKVNVANYVSWHDGYLIFETEELNRIVKKLERYYNINIRVNDPMLNILRISGKLELREEEEKVLNILAQTASVELVKTNESEYILK